jgi:hypothetical protein
MENIIYISSSTAILALIYSLITEWIASIRACRAARWLKLHYPDVWQSVPWFFRTIGARGVGIKLFLRKNSILDPEFNILYTRVKNMEKHSWVSLAIATASIAFCGALTFLQK